MPFRNVTKKDLYHGIANRKEHYAKERKITLKEGGKERKNTPTSKLSDIVNLEDIVKFIVKEK